MAGEQLFQYQQRAEPPPAATAATVTVDQFLPRQHYDRPIPPQRPLCAEAHSFDAGPAFFLNDPQKIVQPLSWLGQHAPVPRPQARIRVAPEDTPLAATLPAAVAPPLAWFQPFSEPKRSSWRPFVPFHPACADAGPAFFLNDPQKIVQPLSWFAAFTEPHRSAWRPFAPDRREYSDPTFGALAPPPVLPPMTWYAPFSLPVHLLRLVPPPVGQGPAVIIVNPPPPDAPGAAAYMFQPPPPPRALWLRPLQKPAESYTPLGVWLDQETAFAATADVPMPWLRLRRSVPVGGTVDPGLQPPTIAWGWTADVARPTLAAFVRTAPITVEGLPHTGVTAPLSGWQATPDRIRPTPAQTPRRDPVTIGPVLMLATVPTGDWWTGQPVPLFPGPRRHAGGTIEAPSPDRARLVFGWDVQASVPYRPLARVPRDHQAGPLLLLPRGFGLDWIGVAGVPSPASWRPFRPEGSTSVYPLATTFTVDALHWQAPTQLPTRRGWQPRAELAAPVLPFADAQTLAWCVQGPVPDRRPVAAVRLDSAGPVPGSWYGLVTLFVIPGPYRVVAGDVFVAGPVQGDLVGE